MKKCYISAAALTIAILLSGFKQAAQNTVISYYFKYVGILGQEEDDTTKWDEITATEYEALDCPGAHEGCKLITTSVRVINGIVRPQSVPVIIHIYSNNTWHKDPYVSGSVIEVQNKTDNP